MAEFGVTSFPRHVFMAFVALVLLSACDSPEDRIDRHMERAGALMDSSVPEKAILEYRNVLDIDENHIGAQYALAEIHEDKREYEAAFTRYRKVVEIQPEHGAANAKLARFYLLSQDLDLAKSQLAIALRMMPGDAGILALKASIEMKSGDLDAAGRTLEDAIGLAPTNVDVAITETAYIMETQGVEQALIRTDQALEIHPDERELHVLKILMLREIGTEPAIGAQLRTMSDRFPEDFQFRQALVQWAIRNGENDIALTELRGLVTAQPGETGPVSNLVRFVYTENGPDAARAELQRLIDGSEDPLRFELMLAELNARSGRRDAAIAELKELAGRAGEDVNLVRAALARQLLAAGELERADAVLSEALAEDPKDVDVLVLSIGRLIDTGQLDTAGQRVRVGLAEAPDDVRLLLLSGQLQELLSNFGLASDQLAKAVQEDDYRPATTERYVRFLLRIGDPAAAEIILSKAVQRHVDSAQLFALLGFTRIQLEEWIGAEQAARGLQRLDADRANQMRAAILIGQERFDEGAGILRDLVATTEQQASTVAALVQTYLRNGQLDEAEAFLEELLAENPQNIQALGIRGNLHLAGGAFAEAETYYRRILAIEPGNGPAHSALSRLAAVQGDADGAEAALRTGLGVSPDSLILLARLARLQEQRGDIDAAIETYERLYTRAPGALGIINNLASLLADHRRDDPEAVDRAYRLATRLRQATLPQYKDTYGWTRYLKGEYGEALLHLAPLAEVLPDNPWIHYHLGMVHAALKQPAEARRHLETALRQSDGQDFGPMSTIRATLEALPTQ